MSDVIQNHTRKRFTKEIKLMDCSTVLAKVIGRDGDSRAIHFFNPWPWQGIDMAFVSAHKWADAMIDVCEKYEASEERT